MEYEIDEFNDAFWATQDPIACNANHMPGWFADSAGYGQTGECIPEESCPPISRSLEPAE
ncbi:MAG: hypothetical protein Q8R44_17440 [Novosphingobium sp.]|nr:hypothetical protein [Novosphingobium sp.]